MRPPGGRRRPTETPPIMTIQNPTLPYSTDALEPHVSVKTLEFHWGKHHTGYVTKLNAAIEGTEWADKSLEDMVRSAPEGGILRNASQAWNHDFLWASMSPDGGGEPPSAVADRLTKDFGSVDAFREKLTNEAATHFGSGWAWLVEKGGKLEVVSTHDEVCPLRDGMKPILTIDVWEHAYYLDYQNQRPQYIEAWWKTVNWQHAETEMRAAGLLG